jgi:uncharacterized protein
VQVAPSYLDELDRLLLDQSDDCMLLTQLDGFLAGIIVCPDLIPPSQWLKCVWTGEDGKGALDVATMADFQHILDLVMHHYNAILADLDQPGSYEPIFDIDTRNDDILWELWIEGFAAAMDLAPDAWRKVARSGDAGCETALKGIATLVAIATSIEPLPEVDEEQWHREAPDLIPIWIEMLHAWRLENDVHRPAQSNKVGRNEPCPCASGKKYKKCCGLN